MYSYGGSYVTAKRNELLNHMYGSFCEKNNIPFHINSSVLSPDNTTLFTTSGMHHFKSQFSNEHYHDTISNIQTCLRLNDLHEIGDGTHYLVFNMLGFFSFREWSVLQTIDYFMGFLESIECLPDYVTIHPDKISEWSSLYSSYSVEIREDLECQWSDGSIGGYCTEFYKNDIEIGNIVNTLGTCIDVGFGGERLLNIKGLLPILSKNDILIDTIHTLIQSGIVPSPNKHGYILRKILVELVYSGGYYDHPYFHMVYENIRRKYEWYHSVCYRPSFQNKSPQWWLDTHGIRVDMTHLFK